MHFSPPCIPAEAVRRAIVLLAVLPLAVACNLEPQPELPGFTGSRGPLDGVGSAGAAGMVPGGVTGAVTGAIGNGEGTPGNETPGSPIVLVPGAGGAGSATDFEPSDDANEDDCGCDAGDCADAGDAGPCLIR